MDIDKYLKYDRMDFLGSTINPEYAVSSFDYERGDGKMKWIDIATSLPPLGASCVVNFEKMGLHFVQCVRFDENEDGYIGFRRYPEISNDKELLIDIKGITHFIILDEID